MPMCPWVNPSMSTGVVIVGSGPDGVIVQVWVLGSKPATGLLTFGAVDAGMSNTMLLGPRAAWFEAIMAARSEPAIGLTLSPLSNVLVTVNTLSSRRDSSGS